MEAERGRARSRRRRQRQHQQRRGETAPGSFHPLPFPPHPTPFSAAPRSPPMESELMTNSGPRMCACVCVCECVAAVAAQAGLFRPQAQRSQEGCRRRGPWPVEDAEVQAERRERPRSSATRGFGLGVLLPPGPLSRAARHDEDAGESAAGRALGAVRAAPTKGSSPAARRLRCVGAEVRFLAPLAGPPGELETVLRPRPRGDEARGRRGRSRRGSVPRSCRRGRPRCPRAGSRPAPLTRARRPTPASLPPPARLARPRRARSGRAAVAAAAVPAFARPARCPLPARIASSRRRRRRPRPRLPPPLSLPARVVANRRPPSCSGSRPDPRQPPAPAQPKRPIFAAARGGSPEGSMGGRHSKLATQAGRILAIVCGAAMSHLRAGRAKARHLSPLCGCTETAKFGLFST
ncbi:uncharacterized protein [Odocoileus virginianus]|uniref:Basic proline-rich protein-like n=1 Tax=Odocoileus virginianus TaxID=9874 RepID=A0ABM4H0M9_ODOVR